MMLNGLRFGAGKKKTEVGDGACKEKANCSRGDISECGEKNGISAWMKRKVGRLSLFVSALFLSMVFQVNTVLAAGEPDGGTGGTGDGDLSAITGPITKLKTLFTTIIGAGGVIILIKNAFEFFQSFQQQDSAGMSSALKGMIAGAGMAAIGTVITFLGVS